MRSLVRRLRKRIFTLLKVNLEDVEKLIAQRWFFWIFHAILAGAWVMYGTDFANIIISILTLEALLLGQGRARRSELAVQAKLDELVHATKEARDDLAHLEDKDEKIIEEIRL
jgi:low affinity Fe/Cu permease